MTILDQILAAVRASFLKNGAFTNTFVVGRKEFLDLLELLQPVSPMMASGFLLDESSARQGTDGLSIRFGSKYGFTLVVFSSPTAGLREL